jgi:glyceraldehyde 3-phosphate dehydrogenase
MARVAINGFGRIGRAVFKIMLDTPGLEIVGLNDIVPADNLAYLLKYDTVYGRYEKAVDSTERSLIVDGREYPVYSIKDPSQLPWKELGVDITIESTGVFTKSEDLKKHIEAGARYVILSAPIKGDGVGTVVHGVNKPGEPAQIISCASCTTNAITPPIEIMNRRIGVKKALMTAIHAYTASQELVDSPSKNSAEAGRPQPISFPLPPEQRSRRRRRCLNWTGSSMASPFGSIADIVFLAARPTSVEEVNQIFWEEAQSDRYVGILGVSDEPIVSSDIIKDSRAAIIDLELTQVIDGDLVKVMSWYDNEWGYSSQLVREAARIASEAK